MCQEGVFKPCVDFTDGDESGCELSQDLSYLCIVAFAHVMSLSEKSCVVAW